MAASDLSKKTCTPCEGGTLPLNSDQVAQLLPQINSWEMGSNGGIERDFQFDNYYQTMAFVNATAWMSHQEDHHPDLLVTYNRCRVSYITHAINGLSENDFICAAKVNRLVDS